MPTWKEEDLWHWTRGSLTMGALLAGARRFRRATQQSLADRLGVSPTNVSRIEQGGDLRVTTLVEISRELGLEPMLVPKEYVSAVRALLDSMVDRGVVVAGGAVVAAETQRLRFG